MKYIVTNFAYGTGPFLRTTDFALDFNAALARTGGERLGIIVPWVYGEKQKRIMLEEFAAHDASFPAEILLDEKLGALLRSVFYEKSSYAKSLATWNGAAREVSAQARAYLSGELRVETLTGEKRTLRGKDIAVELARSPRIRYDVAPSYFSSFAYIAEILLHALAEPGGAIAMGKDTLKKGVETAKWVEAGRAGYAIAYPATFSYAPAYAPKKGEVPVPPIGPVPKEHTGEIEKGMYVTVTGIGGLERLYAEAKRMGLRLYSNDPSAVPGAQKALPDIIPNKNIVFQFARSGWSSVWLSLYAGVPIVVPAYDPADDPEIYFNNVAIERLGIGIVYRGQPLAELLREGEAVKARQHELRREIEARFGTFDGTAYMAERFAADFMKRV